MSRVILPDYQTLTYWVEILKTSPGFLKNHLPKMDDRWVKEVMSIIERVSLSFYKDELHHKSAHIFYKNIKNHCLIDGNKRTAVIVLYLIYLINEQYISTGPMRIRSLARRVAGDKIIENPKIKNSDSVVQILEIIFSDKDIIKPFKSLRSR
jgi:death-on-curing family protein